MASLPRPSEVVPSAPQPDDAILAAVADDVRSTLRMAWVDADLRTVAAYPAFFTAAWSATRPNVTRSFVVAAERVRSAADEALSGPLAPRVLNTVDELSAIERDALARTVQAFHLCAPKVLLVLQAWAALARRQRVPGTGREESPAKRGVPDWQEDLGAPPRAVPGEIEALLDEATNVLAVAATPSILQAATLWPDVVDEVWRALRGAVATTAWREAQIRVRRTASDGLRGLPHPMELQWDVLTRRGVSEEDRRPLADRLTALAASAPCNVLVSAYLWAALGRPEAPTEA